MVVQVSLEASGNSTPHNPWYSGGRGSCQAVRRWRKLGSAGASPSQFSDTLSQISLEMTGVNSGASLSSPGQHFRADLGAACLTLFCQTLLVGLVLDGVGCGLLLLEFPVLALCFGRVQSGQRSEQVVLPLAWMMAALPRLTPSS